MKILIFKVCNSPIGIPTYYLKLMILKKLPKKLLTFTLKKTQKALLNDQPENNQELTTEDIADVKEIAVKKPFLLGKK